MPESGPGTSPAWRRCCQSGMSGRSHAPVTGDQGWVELAGSGVETGAAAAQVAGWLGSPGLASVGCAAMSRRGLPALPEGLGDGTDAGGVGGLWTAGAAFLTGAGGVEVAGVEGALWPSSGAC